jgi:hypothetical protein
MHRLELQTLSGATGQTLPRIHKGGKNGRNHVHRNRVKLQNGVVGCTFMLLNNCIRVDNCIGCQSNSDVGGTIIAHGVDI